MVSAPLEPISAIIPTHARPDLLVVAIDSILAQTHAPAELIVVSDVGDDQSREVVEAAASRASFPVRYVHNDRNPGACGSRNRGADEAIGTLIAFLDDDDVWYPEFLARTAGELADPAIALAVSGIFRQEEGLPQKYRAVTADLTSRDVLQQPGSMTGSNFVMRRAVYLELGGFDPKVTVFNDWDLFVRFVDADHRYRVVDTGLVEWRFHPGERIATPSVRRAAGLDHFLAKYGDRMAPETYRDFKTTALGIRRKHAQRWPEYALLSLKLAQAHGILRTLSRFSNTLRR
jgi:glycosyltransferase involved in cell wall biosynthesis